MRVLHASFGARWDEQGAIEKYYEKLHYDKLHSMSIARHNIHLVLCKKMQYNIYIYIYICFMICLVMPWNIMHIMHTFFAHAY